MGVVMRHPGKVGGARGPTCQGRACTLPSFPAAEVSDPVSEPILLASLASGGRVPRGHFWEDPSSIPSYLPFLISQSKDLLPPLLHRSLHRWLLCLLMVHPLEMGLWLCPGPPPSLQEVFPDGVPLRH